MSTIQDGVYYQSGRAPGLCWRFLLLSVASGASPAACKDALAKIWEMLTKLRDGVVRDLNPNARRGDDPVGEVRMPADNLTCMISYGGRLFNRNAHPIPVVPTAPRPPLLQEFRLSSPPFPTIRWLPEPERRQVDGDIAFQFIADTDLAVNRAAIEVSKLITDLALPLKIVGMYEGFGRTDRRSWIDFHDGINTMSPDMRERALVVDDNLDIPWMVNGTYLAFLKLAVDIAAWRRLTRDQQELIVGRQKVTGCPLTSTSVTSGTISGVTEPGCANDGTMPANPSPEYLDPQRPSSDTVLRVSHIHRTNLNRGADPREPASNRFYRQGFEFLDVLPDGGLRVGLNFVSFQKDLARLLFVLRSSDWIGTANFGGPDSPAAGEPPNLPILGLVAGGFYAVPPLGNPFPGASLFE